MDRDLLKVLKDIARSLRILSGRDTISDKKWTREEEME